MPVPTNARPATYLANSTVQALMGWVRRTSSVPSLCSSAMSRMVENATNTGNIQGRIMILNRGLREASRESSRVSKYRNETTPTNTPSMT